MDKNYFYINISCMVTYEAVSAKEKNVATTELGDRSGSIIQCKGYEARNNLSYTTAPAEGKQNRLARSS